MPKDLLSYLTK
ncbi:unnamed protein product [Linum tenue]|uniref:Uncharacterized protein n=1 Tax=Linum tenue TaxID=586396 RepID=A0AAV0M5W5_9ROSI|nr:unnamed protein product [Linum tenue]CAI0441617.1 unnamed protein product [Linum tenue]CAI0460802.1 unnamed protein product [Linum tenue]